MAQTKSDVADSYYSATRKAIQPSVVDNFFENYNLVALHRRRGMSMTDDGGPEIQVILEGSGGTAEAFSQFDTLSKSPINPFQSAFYQRRYYAVPMVLADTDNWENAGKEKVFDLMNALGNNAMNTLLKAINEDIAGAQSGKNMLGYQDLIADATGATIGGINSGTQTFWESQRDTGSATFTSQTVTNIFDGVDKWQDLLDLCRIQGGNNNVLATTYSIVKAYRISVNSQGYGELNASNAKGLGGAMEPRFYGSEVIADNDIKALATYAIDTDAIKLNVLRGANFRKTPFVSLQPNGQLAQLAYMIAGVQLTTNNRRRSGVATAITGA